MALNDDIASEYIAHAVNLLRTAEGIRGDVLNFLNALQEELRVMLLTEDLANARDRQARIKNVIKEAGESISSTYDDVDGYLKDQLLELADISGKGMKKIFKDVFNREVGPTSLTRKTVEELATKSMIQGAVSKDWWAKQSDDLQGRFANQIRMGMAAGETNDQLVNRVIGRYTGKKVPVVNAKGKTRMVNEYSGGVMAASRAQATALVRTAAQTVNNNVQEKTFDENQDILDGKQLLVTLDGRTSPICQGRSGGAWDFKGKPLPSSSIKIDYPGAPPYHFNCRSILIPITKSWEDLIKEAGGEVPEGLAELDAGTQASMDGQVAGDLTYEQWLKTKPPEFQKEVLGAGKFELWSEGKLSLTEMLDQSGQPLTMTELRAKVGAPITPPVVAQRKFNWGASTPGEELVRDWQTNARIHGEHAPSDEAILEIKKWVPAGPVKVYRAAYADPAEEALREATAWTTERGIAESLLDQDGLQADRILISKVVQPHEVLFSTDVISARGEGAFMGMEDYHEVVVMKGAFKKRVNELRGDVFEDVPQKPKRSGGVDMEPTRIMNTKEGLALRAKLLKSGELYTPAGRAKMKKFIDDNRAPVVADAKPFTTYTGNLIGKRGKGSLDEITKSAILKKFQVKGVQVDSLEELIGAMIPDGDKFKDAVVESFTGSNGREVLNILSGKRGTGNFIERTLVHDETGLWIQNEGFGLVEKGTGEGSRLFGQQVTNAKRLGVNRMVTVAAKSAEENGYYTWARLGYDAEVKGPNGKQNLLELMTTPEGRAWWRKFGDETRMTFDLSPGSPSIKVLEEYIKERERRNG